MDGHSPCPLCGSAHYEWGYVQSAAGAELKFKGSREGFIGRWTGLGGEKMRARLCLDCKNVQLFVERED